MPTVVTHPVEQDRDRDGEAGKEGEAHAFFPGDEKRARDAGRVEVEARQESGRSGEERGAGAREPGREDRREHEERERGGRLPERRHDRAQRKRSEDDGKGDEVTPGAGEGYHE